MTLQNVSVETAHDVLRGAYKHTKLQKFLEEFEKNDATVMEIKNWESDYSTPYVAARTITVAIRRFKYDKSMKVTTSNGRLFIFKLDNEVAKNVY